MSEKKRILQYFWNKFWSRSWIGALLVLLERSRRGIQLSCFEIHDISHGLVGTSIFLNMYMGNFKKHILKDVFHKASFHFLIFLMPISTKTHALDKPWEIARSWKTRKLYPLMKPLQRYQDCPNPTSRRKVIAKIL